MSNAEIIMAALAIASPIVSVIVAILALRRNNKNDTKAEAEEKGVLQSDVGYIKSSIDRVENRLDKMDEKQDSFFQRLTKVEVRLDEHINDKTLHKVMKGSKWLWILNQLLQLLY